MLDGIHPHQWSQLPHERSQCRIFRWGSKMKGGSILCWRTVVGVVGSTSPGAAVLPWASVGFWESRAEWPCSVGIRSERVEAVGAAGRTTWIAVVGLADEMSARRGSAVYPSFTRLGKSLPQHVQVETTCRRVGEPHRTAVWLKDGVRILERVNFGKKITGGVKIIRAQDYAGVDSSHSESPAPPPPR
jgi:hypothetical protein